MPRRLLLFILATLLALVLGYVTFTPLQAVNIVHRGGYWLLLGTVTWFVWHFCRSLRGAGGMAALQALLRKEWPALLLILGLGTWLQVHEERGFKIVADEVLLSSTAMQMHFKRETSAVVRGYEYAGNFTPMNVFLDKRPLLFPFLLCTVHDLTGYRVSNVFVLNGVLTIALVGLTYMIGRRIGGPWAGAAGAILLCGVPLIAQNSTGGGFEILNLVMLFLTLWLGCRLLERAEDNDRMAAFILSGVLLAQVRYESVVFVVPVGAVALYTWWRVKRPLIPGALIAAPLLLVIWPLHHNVFKINELSWQLFDVAGATEPFALRYFYENVAHALNFFFTFDGSQPSSWPLAILGIIACGLFLLFLYKEHRAVVRDGGDNAVISIFLLGLFLHTAVMLCYFWGKWDDPIIRRLSLPAHVLLVLAVLFVWPRMPRLATRWPWLVAGGAVVLFAVSQPAMAMHRYSQENFAARTTNWLSDHSETLQGRRVLAIDNNAGLQWFLHRQSSINPFRLAQNWEKFAYHYQRKSFDDYLVVQRSGVDLATGKRFVSIDDDLGEGITLELIEEKVFSPLYLVRLSRIVAVDEEKLKEWSEKRLDAAKNPSTLTGVVKTVDAFNVEQLADWVNKLP